MERRIQFGLAVLTAVVVFAIAAFRFLPRAGSVVGLSPVETLVVAVIFLLLFGNYLNPFNWRR